MSAKYIINKEGKIVPEPDLLKWALWFGKPENRVVRQERIGDIWVSTVFLGLDHNLWGSGPPVLWETMIFGCKASRDFCRCAGNREQAEAMHEEVVRKIKVRDKVA